MRARYLTEVIRPRVTPVPTGPWVVGVSDGEGIGPEVVAAALDVLGALAEIGPARFEVRTSGPIGLPAEARGGQPLSEEVEAFYRQVFRDGGAVLSGPGGGRFVYDLRRRFDMFCKLSPLTAYPELAGATCLRPEHVAGVDILIVRDNIAGIYQGASREHRSEDEGAIVEHTFSYTQRQVARLVRVAARIARRRSGRLAVVVKDGGIPGVSRLWRDTATEVGREVDVACTLVNADHAAFSLVQTPREFDVVVTPNLFGDLLVDVGAALQGSRGVTFSGNYTPLGHAVYQTNHGSAHDLAGTDRANPAGQILALAMMLHESFGLTELAERVERAVASVWRSGIRTADVSEPGCTVVGTRDFGHRVADAVRASA